VFSVAKCPVCRERFREYAEHYLFMTVREGGTVRVERQPPADCPGADRVCEVHERWAAAFTLARRYEAGGGCLLSF
jgi:hypothetical protein